MANMNQKNIIFANISIKQVIFKPKVNFFNLKKETSIKKYLRNYFCVV